MVQVAGIELQTILILVGALSALAIYGLKWYQNAKKDGTIGISELIDGLEGGEDLVDDVIAATEDVVAEAEAAKKASEETSEKTE